MQLPTRAVLGLYLRLAVLLNLLFLLVYGGSNALATLRAAHWKLYFDWELGIPLVPALTPVYASIVLLFTLPLFCLDATGLRVLAKRMAWAIVLAGAVFLLFPAKLGHSWSVQADQLNLALQLIRSVDRPHNLFPSLHIALSTITVATVYHCLPRGGRALLGLWLLAIYASVLLVHQHHVLDVIGGALLAWLCYSFVQPAKTVA